MQQHPELFFSNENWTCKSDEDMNIHCAPRREGLMLILSLSLQSCQADLVKDNGHKYFLSVLADPYMPVRI